MVSGAGRGGIALIGRLGVGRQQPADVGEALHELHGLAHGHFFATHAVGGVACTGEAAAAPNCSASLRKMEVQIGREVVAHGFHMHAGNAEIAGKERGLEARHDLAEFFERGHGGIVQRMVQNRLKRGRRAQLFHDEIQIGHGRWRYGSEWFGIGVPREGYSPPASEGWGDSPGSRSSECGVRSQDQASVAVPMGPLRCLPMMSSADALVRRCRAACGIPRRGRWKHDDVGVLFDGARTRGGRRAGGGCPCALPVYG